MSAESQNVGGGPCDPATWVAEHGDVLFRYALLRVPSREASEELVQETFLAALRAKDRFRADSSVRTWLIGILRRKIVDRVRQAHRAQSANVEPAEEKADESFDHNGHWKVRLGKWPSDPSRVLEDREFRDALDACVSKLPAPLAHVFVLRELEQLDSEEVCKILEISASNLWIRLHRARMSLRHCLERNWIGRTD